MIQQTQVGDSVHGSAILRADALDRAAGPLANGHPKRELRGSFRVGPTVLPAFIRIRDDFAVSIGGSPHLAVMRGTVVIPTVFVPAHELQADGLRGELR